MGAACRPHPFSSRLRGATSAGDRCPAGPGGDGHGVRPEAERTGRGAAGRRRPRHAGGVRLARRRRRRTGRRTVRRPGRAARPAEPRAPADRAQTRQAIALLPGAARRHRPRRTDHRDAHPDPGDPQGRPDRAPRRLPVQHPLPRDPDDRHHGPSRADVALPLRDGALAGADRPVRGAARRHPPRRPDADQPQLPGDGRRAGGRRGLPTGQRLLPRGRPGPARGVRRAPARPQRHPPHPAHRQSQLPGPDAHRGPPARIRAGRLRPPVDLRRRRDRVAGLRPGPARDLRRPDHRRQLRHDRTPAGRRPHLQPPPPPHRPQHGLHRGARPGHGRARRARTARGADRHAVLPLPGVHAGAALQHRRRGAHPGGRTGLRTGRRTRRLADPRQGRHPAAHHRCRRHTARRRGSPGRHPGHAVAAAPPGRGRGGRPPPRGGRLADRDDGRGGRAAARPRHRRARHRPAAGRRGRRTPLPLRCDLLEHTFTRSHA